MIPALLALLACVVALARFAIKEDREIERFWTDLLQNRSVAPKLLEHLKELEEELEDARVRVRHVRARGDLEMAADIDRIIANLEQETLEQRRALRRLKTVVESREGR